MTKQDALKVLSVIQNEGFDYAFVSKTDFKSVKDEAFHKLRRDYIAAQENLEDYLFKAAGIKSLEDLTDMEDE